MRRRSETDGGSRRASRSAGALPLVAAITSALALTGAAFYTVDRATCGDPAQYIRHDNHIELVGGCVDGSQLEQLHTTQSHSDGQTAEYNNYRP
ncbi:hypothetical protein LWP59_33665 [Amycolatopsis acidiphila]|uniref:Uncharacterized protein n=1 Tax=Amycolatopsis acidiphila TaxID=715473 RepID=A0A557ZUA0_9PSEU|nr:hypothetical protein [Amycolatopsis acidiphila]TVT15592.1 hypothetical protein FNH06_35945 [Amycolatopsis acidiphila]UIJ58973.1 hypothetical protein LWP59_33665 [Amycolatopsis acidiphila]GHG73099.1 hypothetical protein GCM10017788_36180 [Amycolatopsis acidiphila]